MGSLSGFANSPGLLLAKTSNPNNETSTDDAFLLQNQEFTLSYLSFLSTSKCLSLSEDFIGEIIEKISFVFVRS